MTDNEWFAFWETHIDNHEDGYEVSARQTLNIAKRYARIPAYVEFMVKLVETFGEDPVPEGLQNIADELEVSKSTARRHIRTCEDNGWVSCDLGEGLCVDIDCDSIGFYFYDLLRPYADQMFADFSAKEHN